eukprot:10442656-Prorocentrum_lima.AAC.1
MTSSLVGSEMCIRDSPSIQGLLPAYILYCSPGIRGINAGTHWPILHPVSYTHLTLPTICSV